MPECGGSLGGGWGRRRGVAAFGAAVGFIAVAGREFVEEEAGAFGDVEGVSGGVGFGGVLEAGGVLDGEAIGVEVVGGDGFLVGEAEFLAFGLLLLGADSRQTGDGRAEGGGVGGDPAFCPEFGGVFQCGGVGEAGAGDGGGDGAGIRLADLELGAEDGVLAGKGEAGAAARPGGEAFHFPEILLLLGGELGEIADLAALRGGIPGEGGDFPGESGDEFRAKPGGHGGLVVGIVDGFREKLGGGDEGGEGEREFTACAHGFVFGFLALENWQAGCLPWGENLYRKCHPSAGRHIVPKAFPQT